MFDSKQKDNEGSIINTNEITDELTETEKNAVLEIMRELADSFNPNEEYVIIWGLKINTDDLYNLALKCQECECYYSANHIFDVLATVKDDAHSFLSLGSVYSNGYGVKQDKSKADMLYKKAIKCFEIDAKNGDGIAMYELGVCYRRGEGVEQSDIKACEYYKRAIDMGCIKLAANNLGIMYHEGLGVEKNIEKSIEYYKMSANAGSADSQALLGNAYFKGYGVEQNYTEAIYWYLKAAEQGEGDSLYHLAVCYCNGFGFEKDRDKGIDYLYKAAEVGNPDAINALKENGLELPSDNDQK